MLYKNTIQSRRCYCRTMMMRLCVCVCKRALEFRSARYCLEAASSQNGSRSHSYTVAAAVFFPLLLHVDYLVLFKTRPAVAASC